MGFPLFDKITAVFNDIKKKAADKKAFKAEEKALVELINAGDTEAFQSRYATFSTHKRFTRDTQQDMMVAAIACDNVDAFRTVFGAPQNPNFIISYSSPMAPEAPYSTHSYHVLAYAINRSAHSIALDLLARPGIKIDFTGIETMTTFSGRVGRSHTSEHRWPDMLDMAIESGNAAVIEGVGKIKVAAIQNRINNATVAAR